jgi:myo-inositol-1-phosphate synthase
VAKIRIAIVGVGDCASSLVQGMAYYKEQRDRDAIGLLHPVKQFSNDEGFRMTEEFIAGRRED